jgi:hypothetical protein
MQSLSSAVIDFSRVAKAIDKVLKRERAAHSPL